MKIAMKYTAKIIFTSLLLVVTTGLVYSDDVDILVKTSTQEANILFVLDGSASMNRLVPNSTKTRMQVMQDTLKTVLNKSPDYLSVGISSYGTQDSKRDWNKSGEYPNGIKFPITPINAFVKPIKDGYLALTPSDWTDTLPASTATTTVRDYIGTIADSWTPYGQTPIVDALFEAARYYRGEGLEFGYDKIKEPYAAHPSTYVRPAPNAVSPILSWTTDMKDAEGCDVYNDVSTGAWEAWDIGDTNGRTCPADRFNPARPGLASNCALAKVSCATDTYPDCIEPIPKTCLGYDENGDCSRYSGGCKTYGTTTTTTKSCKYTNCRDQTKIPPNYISPIAGECKSNNIILMSDGEPKYRQVYDKPLSVGGVARGVTGEYYDLIGEDVSGEILNIIGNTTCKSNPSGFVSGRCGPELTHYIATHDNAPGTKNPGDQFIDTLVIGFSAGITENAEKYLKSLVTIPDDTTTPNIREGYYSATSEIELATAFTQAIQSIKTKGEDTYSTATYSVNSGISLTHGDFAYVPVFEHSGGASWNGNLKKYEMIDSKLYGKNAAGTKVRATTDSGTFLENVNDLWATTFSTNEVANGGAANKITPATRNVYTNTGSSLVTINSVTKSQLGVTTNPDKNNLLNFIKGENPDSTPRHFMGDIVHSKPVQIATSSSESVVFIGTNEGYVHAIQASTGAELFAFMPQPLLKNIKAQYEGTASTNHSYGVDGQITLWHDDTNHNGIKESTEKAYMFFGLRRGGQAYYALDITTPTSPKLLWEINSSTTGFGDLGFTWATPKVEMLKYQTSSTSTLHDVRPVLVFGGGYIDDHIAINPANRGVGVYIVDAISGNFLQKYTHSDMGEVPSNITALDVDRNGSIDRLYFGDTKANLWRVDLNDSQSTPFNLETAKLTHFAELGGSDAEARQFFSEPDVALFKHKGKLAITVSIGSGLRPDPLGTDIEDHFFMLLDENIYSIPSTGSTKITLSQLLDAPVTNVDLVANLATSGSKKGWKMKLGSTTTGEKSLSKALTYQNKVMFTTFSAQPASSSALPSSSSNSCVSSATSSSKLYIADLLTGGPALDLNKVSSDTEGVLTSNDLSMDIGGGMIPTSPQVRFGAYTSTGGSGCTNDDCQRSQTIHAADKSVALKPDESMPRLYWINEED